MIPYLRKTNILEYINEHEVAYIEEMSKEFNVSISTVRRDLNELEAEGRISLLRGGAVKVAREEYDAPVIRKKLINREVKDIIAQKAAELVDDGDTVYIDSGTTPGAMFKYLRNKSITIVTSGLPDVEEIQKGKCNVIFLGGELIPELESMVGTLTEKLLAGMYFEKAFIGANAYSEEHGVFTFDVREARKKEIVKDHSQKVYLLADTSKAGKTAFSKVFDMSECILIDERE